MIPLCKMIECKFVIEEYDGLGCCLNENTSFTYSNISDYGRDAKMVNCLYIMKNSKKYVLTTKCSKI